MSVLTFLVAACTTCPAEDEKFVPLRISSEELELADPNYDTQLCGGGYVDQGEDYNADDYVSFGCACDWCRAEFVGKSYCEKRDRVVSWFDEYCPSCSMDENVNTEGDRGHIQISCTPDCDPADGNSERPWGYSMY